MFVNATNLDTVRLEIVGESRAVTMPGSVWIAHRDFAQAMLNAGLTELALRDAGFIKACAMLWGYFNTPETHFRERFGETPRNLWPVLQRLMKEGE